jgi:putative transposase
MPHPPHIYLDNTWYIITSSAYHRQHLFSPSGHKDLLIENIQSLSKEFQLELAAWVILDNHYHILIKSRDGIDLPKFFAKFHGRTSFELNRRDKKRGRQVWQNYWDTGIRSETDYWTRFNYIHYNPVKHGYVKDSIAWPYSSYQYYLESKSDEWLVDVFRQYPIIDFTDPRDDF